MSTPTPYQAHASDSVQGDGLAHNPYAAYYQQAADPDLDAAAPQLKATEMRRMNHRALLMLGMAVVMLLFLSYWILSGGASRTTQARPKEDKVTVADVPTSLVLPARPPEATPIAIAQTSSPLPQLPARQPLSQPPQESFASAERQTSLVERRIAGTTDQSADLASPSLAGGAALQSTGGLLPAHDRVTEAKPLPHADTLMQRGTYIRCVLETRVVTDVPGYTSCLVTEPVYSFNGRTLLLPKGSKVLGAYSGGPTNRRVAVVWDRIITPTGIDVDMSSKPSPGIDNLGGAGLTGYYDAHWAGRISSALLISMLSDAFKYEAAEHGPRTNDLAANGVVVQQPFESNTARTVQNLADQAVREAANRAPTITINQGTVIYVYVARDVDFTDVVARL